MYPLTLQETFKHNHMGISTWPATTASTETLNSARLGVTARSLNYHLYSISVR